MQYIALDIQQSGDEQFIRLPKEMQFAGKQLLARKIGSALFLIPADNPWEILFDSLSAFSPDFMEEREQGDGQARTFFS